MANSTLKRVFKTAGVIPQDEHLGSGNCKKVMDGILVPPTQVITADISTTATQVGKGNICRIRVTTASFVQFGASTMSAPTGSEANSLELATAGVYLVVASDDFIMMSAKPARLEVIDAIRDQFGTADATANPTEL